MIIVDTREKKNEHILNYFRWHDIEYVKLKIDAGDYMESNGLISIDKKFGMQEVYSCVVQGHARFRRELKRAVENGIRLIVLIEENNINSIDEVGNWINPRREKWLKLNRDRLAGKVVKQRMSKEPPLHSKQIEKMMKVLSERYAVEWQFCKKADTGRRIVEILKEQ